MEKVTGKITKDNLYYNISYFQPGKGYITKTFETFLELLFFCNKNKIRWEF